MPALPISDAPFSGAEYPLKLTLILFFGAVVMAWAAPGAGPLIPFKVLSVSRTNDSGKPALAVTVKAPARMTNEVLSAVLVNKDGIILCETLGGKWTGGNPCVLLCVQELRKGDYELWLKMNPYQADRVWPNNEADQLGKVVRLKVGRSVKIVGQELAPKERKPRKPSSAQLKRFRARLAKSQGPPPLPR